MKKTEVVEIYSHNNEIHFVLRENSISKRQRIHKGISWLKVKTIMKQEAAKPLLLLRTE